jgi:hypothetical protein
VSAVLKYAVEETLDQLFRLIAFIRKSGIRNRYAKAATFIEIINISEGEKVNFTEKFRTGVAILVNFRHPYASQKIRERLVKTISLRQRQLVYSRKQK